MAGSFLAFHGFAFRRSERGFSIELLFYTTKIATPAANIVAVAIATTAHPNPGTWLTLHLFLVRSDQ